jgi:cysteine synthase
MKLQSARDLVGNTPLLSFGEYKDARLWFKLEGSNPSGSLKDRTVLHVLTQALARNEIKKQTTIIDASSGSHACALAYWSNYFDLKLVTVVNSKLSLDNENFLRALGAEVVKFGDVTRESRDECLRIMQTRPGEWFFFDQLTNSESVDAHETGTAKEIFSELPDTAAIVGAKGSGVTLLGITRHVHNNNISARVFGSTAVSGDTGKLAGTYLHGVDYETEFIKELQKNQLYQDVTVGYDESMQKCLELVGKGVPVGPASGGVYLAALQAIKQHNLRGDIVMMAGDSLLKNTSRF